jgi:hypothetical protein
MSDPASHTLVFPAGLPGALAFLKRARSRGQRVTGASSQPDDPARTIYDEWGSLPFITDQGFDHALAGLLRRRAIDTIFSPHFIIAHYLAQHLPSIAPGIHLVTGRMTADEEHEHRLLKDRVDSLPHVGLSGPARSPLTPLQRVGLLRLTSTIPGLCTEEKIAGLIDVVRSAPRGDIVEIGSSWGQSAALLVCMARHFNIGPVLCIDQWADTALQQDSRGNEPDPGPTLQMFEVNLSPLAQGQLNYLRARPDDAASAYRPGLQVTTDAFGSTRYSGRVAVLHIEGDQGVEQLARDVEAWTSHVLPGGWIAFGSYESALSDGVRTVADDFLDSQAEEIKAVYHAGPALLVQLNGGVQA